MKTLLLLLFPLSLAACDSEPGPETLVKGQDACALCRMPVSDPRFAAQITEPGELPRFFDDPGCMVEFVKSGDRKGRPATAWVADHRSGAWVRADRAVYTRVPALSTPMNHKLIAHETAASRDADPEARGGEPAAPREIFGPSGPPVGGHS